LPWPGSRTGQEIEINAYATAPHQNPTILEELFSKSRDRTGFKVGLCTITGTLCSGNDCRTARTAYRLAVRMAAVMRCVSTDTRVTRMSRSMTFSL
jgi:hypothetical protein